MSKSNDSTGPSIPCSIVGNANPVTFKSDRSDVVGVEAPVVDIVLAGVFVGDDLRLASSLSAGAEERSRFGIEWDGGRWGGLEDGAEVP
eukprot:scaffold10001_cov48-Cyclotella_meneghiniana.AAC.1